MTLLKAVRDLMAVNPKLTTEEVFERVRPQFAKENAEWLRNTICNYRSAIKRKKYGK